MKCLSCETLHDGTYGSGKFCSRSCSNRRNRSEDFRKNLSKIMTGRKLGPSLLKGKQKVPRISRSCHECGSTFLCTENSDKKYCSKKCGSKNIGGYREKSGRSKSGYYRGIYCGSTYELAWVIYQLDHNIPFTRFPGYIEFNNKKYYPDFLQNGSIIEIKGYEQQQSVDEKNVVAQKNGYNVFVLRKEDLKREFEYVKSTYTSKFETLYDEYKPKYNYTCVFCSVEFSKDRKCKTEKTYCSRSCSLKGNRKISGKNQYTKHRDAASVATSPSN